MARNLSNTKVTRSKSHLSRRVKTALRTLALAITTQRVVLAGAERATEAGDVKVGVTMAVGGTALGADAERVEEEEVVVGVILEVGPEVAIEGVAAVEAVVEVVVRRSVRVGGAEPAGREALEDAGKGEVVVGGATEARSALRRGVGASTCH